MHADKIHFLEDVLSETFERMRGERSVLEEERSDGKGLTLRSVDISGDLSLVNLKNYHEIEKLAPFGVGNPKPVFLFQNVKIENIKKFGKNGSGEHLEIIFSDSRNHKAKAISFFSGHDSFDIPLVEGISVNLLATFDLSRFRGREELRLRIEEISSTI